MGEYPNIILKIILTICGQEDRKNAEFNDGEVRSGITGTTHRMDPVS
jgi:major membrane immunogen (membrane-anchored lipoprotein)